jgi:thiamine-phosphate diphosphorylase
LRVRIGPVVDVYDAIFESPLGDFHYAAADFLAEPVDPGAAPTPGDDATAACWAPIDDLRPYNLSAETRSVIERAVWMRAHQGPTWLGWEEALTPVARPSPWAAYLGGALYVITADRGPGRGHAEVAAAALKGGATVVQLRDKRLEGGELLRLAREIRGRAHRILPRSPLVLVNDRADVAAAAEVSGVHLGQMDLPPLEARLAVGWNACVGVSVESVAQARAAEGAGADYLGVGDIYGTRSKADAGAPVGLDHLARIRAVTRLPIVAIGGVTPERVEEVVAAGADAVAVISAVVDAPDMEAAARELAGRAAAAWRRREARAGLG